MWKSSTKRTILGLVVALLATIVAVILTVLLMYMPHKKSSSSSKNQSKDRTQFPSFSPSLSVAPSLRPSTAPSSFPSSHPSLAPSAFPTSVPSSPPSGYPSVSPSSTPTLRPTGFNFVLKQHWEREYFWQETYEEAKWCAECTKCPFLSDSDQGDKIGCTDPDKDDPSCSENDQLWVQGCGAGKGSAVFNLDPYPTYDVLRVVSTDLCLTRARDRFVYLAKCVANNNEQKWKKISFDKPFDLRGPEPFKGLCMSNRHHPKAAEIYFMNDCRELYIYNTALWEAVPN